MKRVMVAATITLVLMSVMVPVVAAQTVEVDMGTLTEGDCNMDNTDINVFDLLIFRNSYNGTSGYDPQADLDNNGAVNVFDLMIFRANYGSTGPVEV